MSRLVKEKRTPRTNTQFNARLTDEQNAAADAQSKADRKKIVEGIVRKLRPAVRNGLPRWEGLKPRRVPR